MIAFPDTVVFSASNPSRRGPALLVIGDETHLDNFCSVGQVLEVRREGFIQPVHVSRPAASALSIILFFSQKGGNAEAVDYQGVLNTARACVELGVPRLLVVSR